MKPLRLLISGFWRLFAVSAIVLALLLSAARLILPVMEGYRDNVAAWAGAVLGRPVRIGALHADWHGWGPSVVLSDVTVLDAAGEHPVLRCASARIDIDVPASLRRWQFEPGQLTVRGVHVSVVRSENGSIAITGLGDVNRAGVDDRLKQWLQRQERLAIEASSFEWRDLMAGGGEAKAVEFTGVNLQLRNREDRHRLDGSVTLPEVLGSHLELAADVQGDLFSLGSWQGQVFARGTAVHPGAWWGKTPPFGLTAADGVVDFQAWSAWQNGVQHVEGDLHVHALHLARQSETPSQDVAAAGQLDIAGVEGGFRWERRATGWAVDVDGFSISRRGAPAPPAQLHVEYAEDKATGRRDIQAGYSALRAEDAAGLLLDAKLVPEALRARLSALAPHGILHDGYVHYQSEPQQTPRWVLRTAFDGLALQPSAPLPGVQGLTGRVTADAEQGVVALATQTAALDFSDLFRAPVPLDGLAGQIVWRLGDKVLQLSAPEMSAHNEDAKLQFGLRLDVPRDGGSPFMDLTAALAEGKGDHVSRYLPAKIMPAAAVAWLDKAIVNGRVSGGTARVHGRLADFPFDNGNGLFDIRFTVADGILDYAPGWPRLEGIATEVSFRGRRFEANATAAKSFNAHIVQARVAIPDLTAQEALLTVEGQAEGPTADAVRYVTQSPLRGTVGAYLDDVAAGGQSRLQLSLSLPLTNHPAKVKGALRIADGSLLFRGAGIDLTHIDGTLKFTEQGFAADAVRADLLGQTVTVAAKTRTGRTGAVTVFSAQGTADAAVLTKRFAPALAPYIAGAAAWQGELRIPPPNKGRVELDVASSLRGMKVSLPAPMGKAADEERNLLVQVSLPFKAERPVHIRYGDVADAQLALQGGKTGMAVASGEVRFGEGAAALPAQGGVRLVGAMPEFDVTQWAAILWPPSAGQPAGAAPVVTQMDMDFGALKLFGRQLDKAHLKAGRGDNGWEADLASEQAAGHIRVPDAVDAPVVMDMERLYLARFKKSDKEEPGADPRKMHPLEIKAKSFHYGNLDLGEFHLHAGRSADGLVFDEVHGHSEQQDLKIGGKWTVENGQAQSSFTLAYDGEDTGAALTSLGFAGIIKGGRAHTDMRLTWPGSPADFSMVQAAGTLSFEVKDGRLLDVDPGAGRILGLLSFQALPRRLIFDFSDLFQKGFAFDKLAGSFAIEKGNAVTDNLVMAGPSARIEARGRVGLAAEDYDQRVMVIPNVSGGLPMAGAVAGSVGAGALTGGVGVGATLLLMQKYIRPGIDKMTQVEYQVTGPWANPTVERLTAIEEQKKSEGKNKNE